MFALRAISRQLFSGSTYTLNLVKYFTSKAGSVFADPTYDNTFRMLCANREHPEIVQSILNNFLNLEGNQQIQEVSFPVKTQNNKVDYTASDKVGDRADVSPTVLENSTRFAADSTVDLLCTTKDGKQIAIEMQRAHEDYFLSRSQLYMSKLLASQVEVGQSSKAHEVMLDTYIICIGKQNIIRDPAISVEQSKFLQSQDVKKRDLSFELTVTPTIHDLWITIQDNKMTWKFFELTKFKEFIKYIKIDHNSPIKYQWMHFLLKCQEAEETPEDVADIIKKGYEIMKMANWTPIQKALYDMEINQEELTMNKIEKATFEGLVRGEAKGIAKGEAKLIKVLLKKKISIKDIATECKIATKKQLQDIKDQDTPEESIAEMLFGQYREQQVDEQYDMDLSGNTSEEDS